MLYDFSDIKYKAYLNAVSYFDFAYKDAVNKMANIKDSAGRKTFKKILKRESKLRSKDLVRRYGYLKAGALLLDRNKNIRRDTKKINRIEQAAKQLERRERNSKKIREQLKDIKDIKDKLE